VVSFQATEIEIKESIGCLDPKLMVLSGSKSSLLMCGQHHHKGICPNQHTLELAMSVQESTLLQPMFPPSSIRLLEIRPCCPRL
jgi:hypothetical protein